MKYAYLGPEGTFTEMALLQVANAHVDELVPVPDVPGALTMVRSGAVDRAVVPIENSVEGGVNATLDTLTTGDAVTITGEMLVPITFSLVARPGTELGDVTRISTHPHAWAQCRSWVSNNLPGAVHIPATSTAAAVHLLAEPGEIGYDAALAAPVTAERYGLPVLATNVGDNKRAVTRFVMVGLPGTVPERTGSDKTTVLVHLPHDESGALLAMLEQFAARGVNLSRIESRPIGDALGRYAFSIDAEGHVADARVQAALMGLKRVCPVVRFLGSYPRADGGQPLLHRGTSDEEFTAARKWVEAVVAGEQT